MNGLFRPVFFIFLFWNTCSCLGTVSITDREILTQLLQRALHDNNGDDIPTDKRLHELDRELKTVDKRLPGEDVDVELETVQLLKRLLEVDRNYGSRAEDGLDEQESHGRSLRQCWFCGGGTGTKFKEDKKKKNDEDKSKNNDWWRKFG